SRPGFVQGVWGDNDVSKFLRHNLIRSIGSLRRPWSRGSGGGRGSGLPAQDFKHHRATSRTTPLDGFSAILHYFFHGVGNFFLRFAFNTISFWHKNFP